MTVQNRSRRDFLRQVALLGVSGLLAACGNSLPAADTAEKPAGSGTLRLVHTLEWAGKEVLSPASPVRFFPTIELLYNRLVRMSEAGTLVPELATAWKSNEAATEWTFTLRQNVRFHNGASFTAKDVIYTLQNVMNPAIESPGAAVLEIVDAEKVAAPDDFTVVFPLKQPHADFPLLLIHYSMYIIPDGIGEKINTTGIGTGPFKLTQLAPEGVTTVVANLEYWAGKPGVAQVDIVGIADSEARTAALLADQIDYVEATSPDSVDLIKQKSDYKIYNLPSGGWPVFVMKTDEAPFDDNRVRMAMKLVVDREAMVTSVLKGYGKVAGDHPVWPGDQYYLDVKRPRDVAKAKALLAEAGYATGLEVTLYTSAIDENMIPMTVMYKEMAAEAGIIVTIQQEPADGYWNDIWMKKPFCCSSWGERTADQVLNEVFRSGATWNETFWQNAAFDGLLDQSRQELDEAKRKALYQQAQQLLADEGGAIIPFFTDGLSAAHARVKGVDTRYFEYGNVTIQG
jgi:peptide/nickel transport system substrate-binding protein